MNTFKNCMIITLINDLEGLILCFKICKYIFNDQNVHLSYNWVSMEWNESLTIFITFIVDMLWISTSFPLLFLKNCGNYPVMQWAFNLSWILRVWRSMGLYPCSMMPVNTKAFSLCHRQRLRTVFRYCKTEARML